MRNANETAPRRSTKPTSFSTIEDSHTSLPTVAEADFAESDMSADKFALNHSTNKRQRRVPLADQSRYQSSYRRDRPGRPSQTNILQLRRGDGRLPTESQTEREPQLRSHSRHLNPAERDRRDAPRPNTRSMQAIDEPPMNAPQGARRQPRWKQGPNQAPFSPRIRLMTEVCSKQIGSQGSVRSADEA